jgi:hypothetical protein
MRRSDAKRRLQNRVIRPEHDMELKFSMPMKLKRDLPRELEHWRRTFGDRTWFLLGWCDTAFTVTPKLGSNQFEFLGFAPELIFEAV